MCDSVGRFKGGFQVTTDNLPYTVGQVKLLHLFDRTFLERGQGLSRSARKTARCSAKAWKSLAIQAILGQLDRGDAGKHLAMKRESSSSDGRVSDRDLVEGFVVELWGSSTGWSSGVGGFEE